MTLFRDWRGQLSWGRFCALVSLIVAVVGQWTGMKLEATAMWLGVALGNYWGSKATEAVALLRDPKPQDSGRKGMRRDD